MSFAIYDGDMIMCTGESLLTYDTASGKAATISLPKLASDKDNKVHNNVDVDSYHGITAVFVSKDGEFFCVCTNRKQLCLYGRSDRALISNRTLVRAASRARFTPTNDIIVADKSGDAYLFSSSKPDEDGKLLLGHLSMLLDVLVTEDNRHVITTDRDEKIRVSAFPNAYNIVSYCLGHTKFVTAIAQLPRDESILVSGGGDGTLRFWDYKNGKELATVPFGDKIPADELDKLNESLKCFELTETVETLPVKDLRMAQLDERRALLAVSLYSSRRILVYTVSKDLEVEYIETVMVEEEPLECLLRDNELWILLDSGVTIYNRVDSRFVLDAEVNKKFKTLNETWSNLRNNANKQSLFPVLYKRKYDNVQEYQERKKSRLGNS